MSSAGSEGERWLGRTALVTGASSGIGAATARALARMGLRVVVWGRREQRLASVAASLEPAMVPMIVDVRQDQAVREGFEAIRQRFGGVDILVNAAGLGYAGNLESGEPERWREMLQVNVVAVALATQEAVRDMRRRGDRGHIFHVSSMSAHRVAGFDGGMYSASKFAVRALAEAQRQELRAMGSRIRLTLVSPGYVRTEFHATFFQDEAKAETLYQQIEPLEADDVAEAIVYALKAPEHVNVHDVLMRSITQAS